MGRERSQQGERGKGSCYWWLLGEQHASSLALTTRPALDIDGFCPRRPRHRQFFQRPLAEHGQLRFVKRGPRDPRPLSAK